MRILPASRLSARAGVAQHNASTITLDFMPAEKAIAMPAAALSSTPMEALKFGRRFFAPDALLALIELLAVVGPGLVFFRLSGHLALETALATLGASSVAWFLIVRAWRAPI